ncbi:Retrovirus-related Pol polyprotein from transposon TNT 1-94-like protein [Drosera capensis]
MDLEIEQFDVKTTFLHGDLEEEIYMEQPEELQVEGKENLVCKLKKSLYDLKYAPQQCYRNFESFMVDNVCKKTSSDSCIFIQKFGDGNFIVLLLYINDMLIVGEDTKKIVALKKALNKSLAMKDLGLTRQILGVQISRDR